MLRRWRSILLAASIAFSVLSLVPAGEASPTDDPCLSAPNVNTGSLLNETCRSWICVATIDGPVISNVCDLPVDPGTGTLYVANLWMPAVMMTAWTLHAKALDQTTGNWSFCPDWSGVGMPAPGSMAPCTLVGAGPWQVVFDFDAPPSTIFNPMTWNKGHAGFEIGRDIT